MKLTKKKTALLLIAILGIIVTFWAYQHPLGKGTLAQVTQVQSVSHQAETDQYQNKDTQFEQRLTLRILNGSHQGQTYQVTNDYDASQLINQRYYHNQRVYVQVSHQGKANILTAKRDWVLILALTVTALILVAILAKKSWLILLSVTVNCLLFLVTLRLDIWRNGTATILLYSSAAIVFATVTFLIYQGWRRKMAIMLLSTIGALVIAFGLSYGIMRATNEQGITYMAVAYATQSPRSLFLGQTLLGVLGAVMDESTDIVTSLSELWQHNPQLTRRQLWHSGLTIGREIMGPLINVLFLIFMAAALPMTILYLRDNNTISYTFEYTLSLGVLQSLISAIGIVLTVPIATLASFLLRPLTKEAQAQ
ncbi:YibE/F family protein [Lapidilactobacillus luobeiensis]|uniref:YibE/F family protein n=1 Tax=Lapidilactobacillus luobeiensis TaxID=2950371 RepID=UPI0021C3F277|nr:YibE/F family protein [Lapidilactobacillus luobeiensis]